MQIARTDFLGLTFANLGNGAEVLWAGAFTLVGIIASVLLALWVQRRDFRRRQRELQQTVYAQINGEESAWRRSLAERAIDGINMVARETMKPHPRPFTELHHEVDSVHTLLHLDSHPGGTALAEWFTVKARQIYELGPIDNQAR